MGWRFMVYSCVTKGLLGVTGCEAYVVGELVHESAHVVNRKNGEQGASTHDGVVREVDGGQLLDRARAANGQMNLQLGVAVTCAVGPLLFLASLADVGRVDHAAVFSGS